MFCIALLIQDLKAWAIKRILMWIEIVFFEIFKPLGTCPHASCVVHLYGGDSLVQDSDIMTKSFDHDTVHQAS